MEKDLGKLNKNDRTDIVLRVDDFGGRRGLTIREYVTSDRYTGFTKAGVRITADNFSKFKEMINSISEDEMQASEESSEESNADSEVSQQPKNQQTLSNEEDETKVEKPGQSSTDNLPDY